VRAHFKDRKTRLRGLWSSTLHHFEDLTFNPRDKFTHIFGEYRKMVKEVKIRDLLPDP
jgi:hypothetical protein